MNAKIDRFLAENRPATPCLIVDLDLVAENYETLRRAIPHARVFYAVKANPAHEILSLLRTHGSCFDTASVPEIDMALAAGAAPEDISYGNTIKKESDIAEAYRRGIRLYAFDSEPELEKIARAAPGSKVFCRILTSGAGADWPLSRKFGCEPEMARELLIKAQGLGLEPYGVSFHIGSQQKDPGQWDPALATCAWLFQECAAAGVQLRMVNLGGGFTARYREDVPGAFAHGEAIDAALARHFGNDLPETIIEPGRGMVGTAGMILTEVVLISRKAANDDKRWVYLDVGKFGGLAETMDEAIQYPIWTDRTGPTAPVILAGPTCDSMDVLYEKAKYELPLDLQIGDKLQIRSTGAYTTTYSAVCFNGFPPLQAIYI